MNHRFHTPQPLAIGETIDITGEELHHAARVVRVREGEEVELFDGRGAAALGVVRVIHRDHVTVELLRNIEAREAPVAIRLALAIINLEKFELVLQKATELGVRTLIPLITERIELRPERYRGKSERWNKILFEAVKQSGRAVIPNLEEPVEFAEVVKRDEPKLLFDADCVPRPAPEALGEVTLLIGPEGGWTDAELALARQHNCWLEKLGPRRLRAETAAIAAMTLAQHRFGDLR
ncbi:MAG TPA: 16S rRNA (uracil(1498)-N(3))-methyltransferase [Thermoanaerobaculia bacterium]|jgi:16S rRNA (uracil1498-N3)-methyltransferase|nr:16S rRNA (uracil(1498)-N(3))-methyltransferase [Thermoanaerobaculia bacterium]